MILQERHRQVLYWLSVGKTRSETATIMGTTLSGIAGLIDRLLATHRCSNAVGLVCKAMATGALNQRLDPSRGSELAPMGQGSTYAHNLAHRLV